MTDREEDMGASLFGKSIDLMEDDPLEEIFALNMGDFVSEYLSYICIPQAKTFPQGNVPVLLMRCSSDIFR